MLQDIAPAIYHNEYDPRAPRDDDYVLICSDHSVLLQTHSSGQFTFPSYKLLKEAYPRQELQYLFAIDDKCLFLAETPPRDTALPAGFHFEPESFFRTAKPRSLAFAGITACSLATWYASSRFCGCCGTKMLHAEKERMMRCPSCGQMRYPTISPAVIVAVTNQDKLLMSKYAGRAYTRFALLAGFNEIGETIEETVHREVMEEVGIRVKNLRFYKSQPWPFSSSLLMGFFCELDGSDQLTIDRNELSEAGWYEADLVPDDTEHLSLTSEMMAVFKHRYL